MSDSNKLTALYESLEMSDGNLTILGSEITDFPLISNFVLALSEEAMTLEGVGSLAITDDQLMITGTPPGASLGNQNGLVLSLSSVSLIFTLDETDQVLIDLDVEGNTVRAVFDVSKEGDARFDFTGLLAFDWTNLLSFDGEGLLPPPLTSLGLASLSIPYQPAESEYVFKAALGVEKDVVSPVE